MSSSGGDVNEQHNLRDVGYEDSHARLNDDLERAQAYRDAGTLGPKTDATIERISAPKDGLDATGSRLDPSSEPAS